jgi:hypothetical protein
MLPQGPQIIGYLGGSLHILFAYEKDEDGEPFDVDGYDAVLNIYQMKPRKLVESVEMTNPEPNRIEAIFSVDDVEELPQNGRYEILFTDKIDSTVTFAMHRDRFAISDVYKSGTTIATVNVSVGDSIETIVNVKFGTIPIKGEQGDSGEPLNVVGDLNDPSELPATGEPGEAYIINTEIWVWSPTSGEFVNMGSFTGPPGATPEIGGNGNWFIDGTDTGVQAKGEDGRGIESITLHDTQGLIKTYRITFTDETTFDFNVTDGEPGADGIQTIDEATDTNFTDTQEDDLQQLESGVWVNKAPAVILQDKSTFSKSALAATIDLDQAWYWDSFIRPNENPSTTADSGQSYIDLADAGGFRVENNSAVFNNTSSINVVERTNFGVDGSIGFSGHIRPRQSFRINIILAKDSDNYISWTLQQAVYLLQQSVDGSITTVESLSFNDPIELDRTTQWIRGIYDRTRGKFIISMQDKGEYISGDVPSIFASPSEARYFGFTATRTNADTAIDSIISFNLRK